MKLKFLSVAVLSLLRVVPIFSVRMRASEVTANLEGYEDLPLESLDGGYVDEDDETFLGLDEDKDDAKVKRCIQRCGRRYTRDSRSYYNCSNQCRNGMGSSYCTWEPDTSCYKSGWPRCCSRDNGINCPATRPACDRKKIRVATVMKDGLPVAL
ncbi:predicted protein [Thalassiosira pseudonana CCMP1335]|uniref:Uncharacterized protein n=1 Tax=Thalassiosira pseudonana TaxID=35128 RepID=B8C877_THAPS|nr:predicted protein [Thalassiosira pseudonana CCMP1335]EED90238.1 predicted protein [Thalassiosira pseudonana CCMP1335]